MRRGRRRRARWSRSRSFSAPSAGHRFAQQGVERLGRQAGHDLGIALHQPAIAVPGQARIAGQADQPLDAARRSGRHPAPSPACPASTRRRRSAPRPAAAGAPSRSPGRSRLPAGRCRRPAPGATRPVARSARHQAVGSTKPGGTGKPACASRIRFHALLPTAVGAAFRQRLVGQDEAEAGISHPAPRPADGRAASGRRASARRWHPPAWRRSRWYRCNWRKSAACRTAVAVSARSASSAACSSAAMRSIATRKSSASSAVLRSSACAACSSAFIHSCVASSASSARPSNCSAIGSGPSIDAGSFSVPCLGAGFALSATGAAA